MNEPLTVLQVLPALQAGGVERGTLEVAEALVRHGHRSLVISAGGRLVADLEGSGSKHITMPAGRKSPLTLRYVRVLRRYLREAGVDILHASSRFPAWICYLAWKGMDPADRPGYITGVHGPYSVNPYSRIMLSGERIIAISDYIRTYILENYPGVEENRISVIPRGVSPEEFPYGHRPSDTWLREWRADYPALPGRHLITLPARLTRWKGQEAFLRIMKELSGTAPFHGLVVGGPHPGKEGYLEKLRKMAGELGLASKVTFTGHRDDIREIMSISGVVLSLSTEPEAFGRTTLEALALGVPVIGYDHGGVGEVLRKIFPAGLAPVGDASFVAGLIRSFYGTRPVVPDNNPYTLQNMQGATLALYESLARQRTGRGAKGP